MMLRYLRQYREQDRRANARPVFRRASKNLLAARIQDGKPGTDAADEQITIARWCLYGSMSWAEPHRRVRRRPQRVVPPGRSESSLICQRLEIKHNNAPPHLGEYPAASFRPGERSIQYRLPRARTRSWDEADKGVVLDTLWVVSPANRAEQSSPRLEIQK